VSEEPTQPVIYLVEMVLDKVQTPNTTILEIPEAEQLRVTRGIVLLGLYQVWIIQFFTVGAQVVMLANVNDDSAAVLYKTRLALVVAEKQQDLLTRITWTAFLPSVPVSVTMLT
jgi:hypothetical protein